MHSIVIAAILLLCVGNSFSGKIFFEIEKDVFFKLYDRNNPENFTILNHKHYLESSPAESFEPKLPTRICIHGYLATEAYIDRFRKAYLNVGDFNFISVDWSRGAFNPNYYVSKDRIKYVSKTFPADQRQINKLIQLKGGRKIG